MTLLITSLIIAAALAIYFTVKDKPKPKEQESTTSRTCVRRGLFTQEEIEDHQDRMADSHRFIMFGTYGTKGIRRRIARLNEKNRV